jgi:hypothetical protein
VAGDLELDASLLASLSTTPPQPVAPRGVWRVAVPLGPGAGGQGPTSLLPLAQRLHDARLLGRDFRLDALTPFDVVVQAELELATAEIPPGLPARLRARLDAVIAAAAAAAEPGGLRAAALIQALQAAPEVRRVVALNLASDPGGPFHPWHLALPGRGARLHPASPLRFSHRGLPLEAPPLLPGAPSPAPAPVVGGAASTPFQPAPPAPPRARPGRRQALASHRSLARLLPAVYGVGPAGLPADATPERRAQALQLRAYLLLFDQLLANGQAQLAHAASLLSPLDPADPHPLDAEGLLPATDRDLPLTDLTGLLQGAPPEWPERLRQALRASAPPSAAGQRAALLAHLLRLFGEELSLESCPAAPAGSPAATAEALATRLVAARSEFLRRIVPLTAGRGSGPDLLSPASGEAGLGPCAERLRRKLGLPLGPDGAPPLLVIEHLLLRPLPEDSSQRVQGGEDPIPYLSDVARPDPWSARVSVVINAACLPAMADAERDRWLCRTLRQELPAHLLLELHLLSDGSAPPGEGPWSTLVAAWHRFHALLRRHRLTALGEPDAASPDPQLLTLRLRDSRDHLISLLRIGLPWPLRAIPLPDQILVASRKTGPITLPYSQKGVLYQLVDVATGALVGTSAEGTDGPLTLTTPVINDDATLRVLASVLAPRPPGAPLDSANIALTASGRARSTLLAGEIRVVEGIDLELSLRLLDADGIPLPRLHRDGEALLAHHGARLQVEVAASQEGVWYGVIDATRQKPLSVKAIVGTSSAIQLQLKDTTTEDCDLAVRASLKKQRGSNRAEVQKILTTTLLLRVRANPNVPLRLLTPVVEEGAPASVAIGPVPGAAQGAAATPSQASVTYLLHTRSLTDQEWSFPNPAANPAHTRIDSLEGFEPQQASGSGNGDLLTLQQPISGEGLVVAALASKKHCLGLLSDKEDLRTFPSEVPLHEAVVACTNPDAQRRVLLLRDPLNPSRCSFWGGQPGVAYTLKTEAERVKVTPMGPSLALPPGNQAPGGVRGINRAIVGRDLVVEAVDGVPRQALPFDPGQAEEPRIWARFLRSGVEVTLKRPPILVWANPPGICKGERARVMVSRLDPGQRGRLLRDAAFVAEGAADGAGNLSLDSDRLPGACHLQLDVGVTCSLDLPQSMALDLSVRVLDHHPLVAGSPAHLLDWGGAVVVEVANSEANVSYALINADDRDQPLSKQTTLGDSVRGNGGPLRLRCESLREDIDLLVRATRTYEAAGTPTSHSMGYLTTTVPLRVRANPNVPLRLLPPVVEEGAPASVAIGDAPAASSGAPGAAPVSQASVAYRLHTRPLTDQEWRFPNPAAEPALTTITGALASFSPQQASDHGNGDVLTLEQPIDGEGLVVAALASKEHRLGLLSDQEDLRTFTSAVALRQAAVAYSKPDAQRPLLFRRDAHNPSLWSLESGQPGVAYTLKPKAERVKDNPMGPLLALPAGLDAPGGARGIDRAILGRDLVVEAVDGVPRHTFPFDPSQPTQPRLWAHFLRSGIEVELEHPPLLAEPLPQAMASVVGRGRVLRHDPVPGIAASSLPGGVTIDLPVRVLNGEPLSDDSTAHLLDWDASAEVEVGDSQVEVSYTLINAAERDRPAEEQTTFCPSLRGTGGVLGLRCEGLREDVDLLVRATPVVDDAEQWFAADVLSTTVLLRVRPNPAVPVALVEPLLNPASEALLWVGEEALPSQASVTYSAWRLPLQPEDWDCVEAAETGAACTPRLPAPPPPSAPADAGWSGRGQPQTGTDGEVSRGIDGRLRLSLGPAEADAVLAVVASKWHNPGLLANPDAPGAASATVLQPLVAQLTRPDPERRLALVANGRGYGLVGGEPGTFYTLQRPADGATVGVPMYVPQRTSADPPTNWGLGWQRLNRDMVVASDAGPGFDGRPHVTELQRAVVEARRAFSGATIQMRRKALVVIPWNMGTVCRIMVWGLAPEERISLLRVGSQPPPQPISKAGVKDGSVGLDIRGPVPADTEVTLEISQEGSDQRWSFTARLFTPRTSAP